MEIDLKPYERNRVVDTNDYPHYSICLINLKSDDGKSTFGTGFLIGPRIVLTCAHNLHDFKNNRKIDIRNLKIFPCLSDGSGKVVRAINFEYPKEY